jgi:hypothetical protein
MIKRNKREKARKSEVKCGKQNKARYAGESGVTRSKQEKAG